MSRGAVTKASGWRGGDVRPIVPWWPGRWLASLYARVIARRNRRYDQGLGVVTLDRPVISVGNLSVGGTGKTPMTLRILEWLREAGHHPVVAMRGYRGGPDGSDEATLYREGDGGVPGGVVARPDRVAGLLELFADEAGEKIDAIVLDDGFQHRRLARQFDLVLIDATRDPFADALLPAGWLREPAASLKRAHAVVITHAEAVPAEAIEGLRQRVLAINPRLTVAEAAHEWSGILVRDMGGGIPRVTMEPVEWLRGKRVLAVCAIGNPGPFIARAKELGGGGAPVAAIELRDHDPYSERTVARIIAAARDRDIILTTQKDWVKLRRVVPERWPCAVGVVNLEIRFRSGGEILRNAVLTAAARAPDADESPDAGVDGELRLDRLTGEAVGEDAVRD